MGFSLDQLFQTFYNQSGSAFLLLKFFFLVLLSLQLSVREEYDYPDNYVTRIFPLSFRPFANVPILSLIAFSDNACKRTIFGAPITCDYIVVGSGAAGAVVARRLSDNENNTVCLVEAGGDTSTESVPPQFFPFGINNTNVWQYKGKVVNTSSMAFKGGCSCIFGKQLGGTTGTNAMVYLCGNDRDYNYWASLGNTNWSYADVLPYIKKSQNNLDPVIVGNGTYHSTGGPLTISTNIHDAYIPTLEEAFKELNYTVVPDYNAQQYNGFVYVQSTTENGERVSSYRAFLSPVKNRANLYFFKNSHVTQVLFKDKTAIGVNIRTNIPSCLNIKLNAKKEVILSAGTFGTTKIMLQSGLGRLEDLAPFGITQIADLNVGNNFAEHAYAIPWIAINPNNDSETSIDVLLQAFQYLRFRTGPFSTLGTVYAEGIINTQDPNATYPDIQMTFYRFEKNQQYFKNILANFGYDDPYISQLVNINKQYQVMSVFVTPLNPLSRGTVKLRSSDPLDPPIITTNFFNRTEDLDTLVRGLLRLVDLVNTKALQATKASFVKFDIPECNAFTFLTADYWKCYSKYVTANEWHPTGTCKMGNSSDPNAVVDPTLKVYKVKNLRACDLSILPSQPSSNTQCVAYMVGERCADFVKAANP